MNLPLKQFVTSTTTRLATTYLLIIMLMSIGFSVVFYNTTSNALDRQVPHNDYQFQQSPIGAAGVLYKPETQIRDFLSERADEGRQELIVRLLVLNCLALIAGGALSYYLARRTLQPIEDAMLAQAQFVSDASHELRTPLTSIQTSNDVALRSKKLSLTEAKQVIADNTAEVIKLKQLSDGLLDLARHGDSHHKLEPIAVQAAVSDALNQVIPIAQAKDIAVEDETPKNTVLSNQHVLGQIIVILLDNAIKYSPDGSTVHISATQKGNYLYLQVRDQGVGIRASDLPHIFRRFYRADTARTANEGYGLGLSIADSLARAHDASLQAASEVGEGSTFTIKLRLAKS